MIKEFVHGTIQFVIRNKHTGQVENYCNHFMVQKTCLKYIASLNPA